MKVLLFSSGMVFKDLYIILGSKMTVIGPGRDIHHESIQGKPVHNVI